MYEIDSKKRYNVTHVYGTGWKYELKNVQLKNAPKELQKDDSYTVIALKERYLNDVIVRTLLEQEFQKRKIEASERFVTDIELKAFAEIFNTTCDKLIK